MKQNGIILVVTDLRGVNRAFVTENLAHLDLGQAIELVQQDKLNGLSIVRTQGRSFLRSKIDTSSKNNLETVSISAKKLSKIIKEPTKDERVSFYSSAYSKYLEHKFGSKNLVYLDGIARIEKTKVIGRIKPLASAIKTAAKVNHLDHNLVAAVLIDELVRMGPDDLLDILGKIGFRDTTIGLAQIKMSTARDLIKKNPFPYDAKISDSKLYEILNDDTVAVEFASAYLKFISKFREKKNKGTSPADLATSYSAGLLDPISSRGIQIADTLTKLAMEILK